MKKILCYGDSNTFGYKPDDGSRYDDNNRSIMLHYSHNILMIMLTD